MNGSYDVLVIGAGIAGMEASLLLAKGSKRVCLVEKLPLIGGNIIKNEESYPHLECSTCMVAPIQQEILQNADIDVKTLCTVEKVEGEAGRFQATLHQKARYVSLEACIGCGMCYDPCPVSLKNEWEEHLGDRKAIYVPCAGALPNVPVIDSEHCLRLNGKKDCMACQEACMFAAIDYTEKDQDLEIEVGAILVATGFETLDVRSMSSLGYGKHPGVYTAMEFERLFASNGPTSGELVLRDGETAPQSVAVVHCVGREARGYCSGVCCMTAFKHAHFIKHKLPDARVTHFYSDVCVPGKASEAFVEKVKGEGIDLVFQPNSESVRVVENGKGLGVTYTAGSGAEEILPVDMVILESAMVPDESATKLAEILGIPRDKHGFFQIRVELLGSTETASPGIFLAGCAEGPMDAQNAVLQAESAVAHVMKCLTASEVPEPNTQE